MHYIKKTLLILSFSVCGMGCTSTTPSSPQFGNSVKSNIQTHAIRASKEDKNNTFISPDKDRQQLAIERYKKDEVEELVHVRTTN